MKIDAVTGDIEICGMVVPADLILMNLLANIKYRECIKISENSPFATYKFDVTCAGRKYVCSLYFKAGSLTRMTIYVSESRDSSSWSDWSEADEQKKLQHLVDMLVAQGISNRQRFAWGMIEATYDPRAGASSITVQYLP
jgi:hypothetical protein